MFVSLVFHLSAAPDPLLAQPAGGILVLPFDNVNREARLSWLSEASAVLLADNLNRTDAGSAITREERVETFERLQLPATASVSHATKIKVGHLLGATEIIIGSVDLSADVLTVRARAIELDTGRMRAEIVEHGPLADLFATFERLARRVAQLAPTAGGSGEDRHVPLSAFENYVRGLLAEAPATQTSYFEAALKISPTYDATRLALWDVFADQGDHERARASALAVGEGTAHSRRARFRVALSEIHLGRFEDAFEGLKTLHAAGASAAVLNNLGVIQVRRGGTLQTGRPTYFFDKATTLDPDDPDLCFNLGYAYWLDHDLPAAISWLRETVRRRPSDGDAHFVLGAALLASGSSAEGGREKELARRLSASYIQWEQRAGATDAVPRGMERLKTDLEPSRSRRVEVTLGVTAEREQRDLATFHLDRGRRLFQQERDREAVGELLRSVYLSPYQAEPHLLLGRLYLRAGRPREAIDALKISLWSEETAAAHVALGEAFFQAKDQASARAEAQRALAIDPASADAKALLQRAGGAPDR